MEKWGGTNEEMFKFARDVYKEHADDPLFGLLVVQSHDEMGSRLKMKDQTTKQAYFENPQVANECRQIIDSMLEHYPDSLKARNWLVKILYLTKKYPEALRQFDILADQYDKDVWSKEQFFKTQSWVAQQAQKEKQ